MKFHYNLPLSQLCSLISYLSTSNKKYFLLIMKPVIFFFIKYNVQTEFSVLVLRQVGANTEGALQILLYLILVTNDTLNFLEILLIDSFQIEWFNN